MIWEIPLAHYAKRLVMIDHHLGDEDYHLAVHRPRLRLNTTDDVRRDPEACLRQPHMGGPDREVQISKITLPMARREIVVSIAACQSVNGKCSVIGSGIAPLPIASSSRATIACTCTA